MDQLFTESRSPYVDLDVESIGDILKIINDEDRKVAEAVRLEIPRIEKAVDIIVDAFQRGGRLFYIGAGTSGRLGVLDASEAPPTFGVEPEMIRGIIAGGDVALREPTEDAEDATTNGEKDVEGAGVTCLDVVVGITASGRTPYVIGAVEKAKSIGAKTIGIVCNPGSELEGVAEVVIAPVVGPEVLLGSTRMKAGTAQKLVLNMLSTTSMIKMGKAYSNLMVDLKASNEKLWKRGIRIVMMATDCDMDTAERAFKRSGGRAKHAIVAVLTGCDIREAEAWLERGNGFVRKALSYRENK